ncbi:MAG TPA: hypothetical protein VLW50_20350 [Streptosporangiaceae bacterium]|nr:hypothetical protein [Streptosporangiaceae bacterium]
MFSLPLFTYGTASVPQVSPYSIKSYIVVYYPISECVALRSVTPLSVFPLIKLDGFRVDICFANTIAVRRATDPATDQNPALIVAQSSLLPKAHCCPKLIVAQSSKVIVAQSSQATGFRSYEAAEDPVGMRVPYYFEPLAQVARKCILWDHRAPGSADHVAMRGIVDQNAIATIGQCRAAVGRQADNVGVDNYPRTMRAIHQSSSLWLAVVLLAGATAADLVSAVYRQTILQLNAPDQMRAVCSGWRRATLQR